MLVNAANRVGLYGVYAPTYKILEDATIRAFTQYAGAYVTSSNDSRKIATLCNGSEVMFRSLDDPENARGPSLSGAWIDEAQGVTQMAFAVVLGRLREGGEMGWIAATYTPKGPRHWTSKTFVDGPDSALFVAKTSDNPFRPDNYVDLMRSQYTSAFASQELDAEIVDLSGTVAKREWFGIVPAAPKSTRKVRAWDFAATAKTTADYTVGSLMSKSDSLFHVEHVIRRQCGPADVEALVLQTARADGVNVEIAIEQEPGASGKMASHTIISKLAGYNVRRHPPTGDKIQRAMPMLAQAQVGNVRLVHGAWNTDWLDELSMFGPDCDHDDQVDSASLAFNVLAKPVASVAFG